MSRLTFAQATLESTHRLRGSEHDLFKIGAKGFVYRFDGYEWMRSTVINSMLITTKAHITNESKKTTKTMRTELMKSIVPHIVSCVTRR